MTTTGDLYRLLETAANDLGQATYDAQRAAYLTTHPSAKRFRYTPTADHRFLIVLLGTSHLDACGHYDLITSYASAGCPRRGLLARLATVPSCGKGKSAPGVDECLLGR